MHKVPTYSYCISFVLSSFRSRNRSSIPPLPSTHAFRPVDASHHFRRLCDASGQLGATFPFQLRGTIPTVTGLASETGYRAPMINKCEYEGKCEHDLHGRILELHNCSLKTTTAARELRQPVRNELPVLRLQNPSGNQVPSHCYAQNRSCHVFSWHDAIARVSTPDALHKMGKVCGYCLGKF